MHFIEVKNKYNQTCVPVIYRETFGHFKHQNLQIIINNYS